MALRDSVGTEPLPEWLASIESYLATFAEDEPDMTRLLELAKAQREALAVLLMYADGAEPLAYDRARRLWEGKS